jgi:hypothetical protein
MPLLFLKEEPLLNLNLTLQTLLIWKNLRNINSKPKKYLINIKTIKTLFTAYFKTLIKNNK